MKNHILKIKAKTTCPIVFVNKNGHSIVIEKGQEIIVDPENNVAFFNQDHFFIGINEYKVMYLN